MDRYYISREAYAAPPRYIKLMKELITNRPGKRPIELTAAELLDLYETTTNN
jgi:hypothetical protein